jgi:hypothetical protein
MILIGTGRMPASALKPVLSSPFEVYEEGFGHIHEGACARPRSRVERFLTNPFREWFFPE